MTCRAGPREFDCVIPGRHAYTCCVVRVLLALIIYSYYWTKIIDFLPDWIDWLIGWLARRRCWLWLTNWMVGWLVGLLAG